MIMPSDNVPPTLKLENWLMSPKFGLEKLLDWLSPWSEWDYSSALSPQRLKPLFIQIVMKTSQKSGFYDNQFPRFFIFNQTDAAVESKNIYPLLCYYFYYHGYIYFRSVMSYINRCPLCKKTPTEPVNLKCDHHPCYLCIQSLVALQTQSKIETKYKVYCPTCNKKTVFYDLRHLIITHSQQGEQQLFVTDKFLNSKPELKLMQNTHQNSYASAEVSKNNWGTDPLHSMTKRGSIHSLANGNKMLHEVKCLQHNEIYKYFCSDCFNAGSRTCLLCGQCSKPHSSNNHKLILLKQAENKLFHLNLRSKEEMMTLRSQISQMISKLGQNRGFIENHYRQLEDSLNIEFKKLFNLLNQKYSKMRAALKEKQDLKIREIVQRTDKLNAHDNILQTLEDIELKDMQTSLKFYQTYQKYSLNNQLAHVKMDFEVGQLPDLVRRSDQAQKQIDEWIAFKSDYRQSDYSRDQKNRKNSIIEEAISHRSARDKENRKSGTPSTQIKFTLKNMNC